MQRFRLQVSVAPQHLPVLVARDQGHLLDGETCLEEAACALVAKVVEVEVFDLQVLAGAAERRACGRR